MKVPKPLKVAFIVCAIGILVVIGVVVLWTTKGNTRTLGVKPYSDEKTPTAIKIHLWNDAASETVQTDVDMTAETGTQLSHYLTEVSSTGGTFSLTTFAPSVVIKSDLVEVNILEFVVVISKRSRTSEGFTQWVREKNADDEAIERLARSFLPQPTPTSGVGTPPE